VPSSANQFAIT